MGRRPQVRRRFGDFWQISGDGTPGWLAYRDTYSIADPVPFETVTTPYDPLLLYFTSGTTSRPKLVQHNQVSYPSGKSHFSRPARSRSSTR
ncbi:hypothetical protein CH298_21580 [Rhodococcoides fascians]|nr:hypothetical protein CH303_21935 [Rhodococcus fascians]OZF12296.1 hypothetical protein CH298_21580 [Rhodococcus fascians]OZF15720.1 hypothetical protein CH297_21960 [Rhodococcus fascians]OZF62375.1 hypothetical protein CH308_21855 [Rhodococcus fascians]OZF64707.1 hypothetical protein CH307_22050 [Rhodococcus fascians]